MNSKPIEATAGLAEKAFTVLVLILMSGGFTQNDFISFPITIIIFAGMLFGLFAARNHLKSLVRTSLRDVPMLLLLLLALASVLWTLDFSRTFQPSLWLIMLFVFGVYVATRYTLEEQLQLLMWTIAVSMLLSIVFTLAVPASGMHMGGEHDGRWRGIYTHKNEFGRYLGLGAVLFFCLGYTRKTIFWLMFPVAVVLIVLAGSATAVTGFVVTAMLFPLYRLLRNHHLLMVGILLILLPVIIAIIAVLVSSFDDIVLLLGRDLTLTGRTDLWEASLELIGRQPVLGYGYQAAFAPNSPIHDMIIWNAPFAHNHWIDLTINMGLLGAALFGLSFLRTFWRAIVMASTSNTLTGLYPLLVLTYLSTIFFTTDTLVGMHDFFWVFYVSMTLSLAYHFTVVRRYQIAWTMPEHLTRPVTRQQPQISSTADA